MSIHYRTNVRARVAGALAVSLLAACGDTMPVTPVEYQPPLATLTGTISVNQAPMPGSEIRVALLWATNSQSFEDKHIKHFVAQDVAVTGGTWPAQFELAITDLPPENALEHGAAGGAVVAYRDLNHNQKLDFTPPEAEHFVDELVAFDSELVVWYSDPEARPGYTPGFSTSQGTIDTPITLTESPSIASSCHLLEWELKDPYDGPAGTGPWGPMTGVTHMNYCPESPVQVTADGVGTELGDGDGSPPPETSELVCHSWGQATEDNYDAYWSPEVISPFILETCGQVVRTCSALRVSGSQGPSGWPCPCDPSKYTCTEGF